MKATLLRPIAVNPSSLKIVRNTLILILTLDGCGTNDDEGLEVFFVKQGKDTRITILTDFSDKMRRTNQRLRPAMQMTGPEVPRPQEVDVPDGIVKYTLESDPKPHGEILNEEPGAQSSRTPVLQVHAHDLFLAWKNLFETFLA